MSGEPKIRCICCHRFLSVRQVYRHLAAYRNRLLALEPQAAQADLGPDDEGMDVGEGGGNEEDLDVANPIANNAGPPFDDDLPALEDVVPVLDDVPALDSASSTDSALDDVGLVPDDASPAIGNANPVPGDAGLGLGNANVGAPFAPVNGLRHNPPIVFDNWYGPDYEDIIEDDGAFGDDGAFDDESAFGDDNAPPMDDPDRDPDYIERDMPPALDPIDEPRLGDQQMREVLQAHLGDLADEVWIDMYSRIVSSQDYNTLSLLATRLRTHFSRQTWEDLRRGVCKALDIPSEFVAWRRLRVLSNLESDEYDCCINSCCCYLGRYSDLDQCPFCREARYNACGRPRRTYRYTPLIPQLRGLFQSMNTASELRYRANTEQTYDPNLIRDVFDGDHYRSLRQTPLHPNGEYKFFDNPEDIALGISTDGFTVFKRKRRGLSVAWPIILVNYNFHPRIRTRLENVICVGVVPGPKTCKDFNSYLIPLLDEFLKLMAGVQSSGVTPEGHGYNFLLRAFVILGFADIPALAKMLLVKAQNALSPCRACVMHGVLCQLERNSIYYLPLRPPEERNSFPLGWLPAMMRTHELILAQLAKLDKLDAEGTKAERNAYSRAHGIVGRSIFAHLPSIDLSSCFPYDFMHLIFENLVPNMIRHWIGDFKGLDEGQGRYQISPLEWAAVGRLTAEATRTIPSAFVGTLPNIEQDRNLFKAEAYSFWFQYLAPILLAGRLPEPYYSHMLLMREVIVRCLKLEITRTEVDELEEMIQRWVTEYEQYYYQYQKDRLPACPLTIHALLHIPYYIRKTGPPWDSWAFVMERFCGRLLPAVKNRVRPYEHMDNYVQRRAQMQIVSKVHGLPWLSKSYINYRYEEGVEVSSREILYPEFPDMVLGVPIQRNVPLTAQLCRQMTRFFGPFHPGLTGQQIEERIDRDSIVRYGRFRIPDGGDHIRTASAIRNNDEEVARDNSFVKFDLLPDANAVYRNRADEPFRQTQYGQLLDIYYVKLIKDDNTREPFLLARVALCNTGGRDASLPENPVVTFDGTQMERTSPEIILARAIFAVVGRVRVGANTWAIVDRSRDCARPQFVDAEGNVEFD